MSLTALKIRLQDHLRYCPRARALLARWYALRGRRMGHGTVRENAAAVSCLCRAARLAVTDAQMIAIERSIAERITRLKDQPLDWTRFDANARSTTLEKAALLKPRVSEREPGVLYISFEYQWLRLLALPKLAEFARDYTLVLAPSWSPPHSLVNCAFPDRYPAPVFCQISHERDLRILPRLSPKYLPVPLLASHWVNPDWFQPRPPAAKDVDIVVVANFGQFKRHHALFHALRDLPAGLRVLLIGQREAGRTAASVRAEARAFGVEGRFELKESLPHPEVCDALARAKLSLILSRREGSCVVVAESLFADTPVGMYADAEIGSRLFINEQTGRFLQYENLAAQLRDFLASAAQFQPRKWALENQISCHGSSAKLNQHLRDHALANGQQWTVDLAPLQWRPNPQLVREEDRKRLQPHLDVVASKYGLTLGG